MVKYLTGCNIRNKIIIKQAGELNTAEVFNFKRKHHQLLEKFAMFRHLFSTEFKRLTPSCRQRTHFTLPKLGFVKNVIVTSCSYWLSGLFLIVAQKPFRMTFYCYRIFSRLTQTSQFFLIITGA